MGGESLSPLALACTKICDEVHSNPGNSLRVARLLIDRKDARAFKRLDAHTSTFPTQIGTGDRYRQCQTCQPRGGTETRQTIICRRHLCTVLELKGPVQLAKHTFLSTVGYIFYYARPTQQSPRSNTAYYH